MGSLSEERRAELKASFDEFDENGDGSLGHDEVIKLMQICGANPSEDDVQAFFAEIDKDADSRVSFDEFCMYMEKDADPENTLREAFAFYDQDGSGYLDRQEIEGMLGDSSADPDLRELIEHALADDDKVDYNELVRLMQNPTAIQASS